MRLAFTTSAPPRSFCEALPMLPIHQHIALVGEQLNARPAQPPPVARNELIEPLPYGFGWNVDRLS